MLLNRKAVIASATLIGAILAVGAGLGYWKYRQIAAGSQGGWEPPEFIEVAAAQATTWQPTARLVGTVIAKRSVNLANEVVGVITEVGFNSGDTVQPGQVLIRLDNATEQADLAGAQAAERLALASIDIAKANVRAARANLQLAEANHRRTTEAARTGSVVTETELDRAKAELEQAAAVLQREDSSLESAAAELDERRADVRQIQTTIAKKTLTSPFLARVGMRTVHPGQFLAEGTTIVSLTELTDDIYVDFAVPQEYAARVTPGTVVMAKSDMLGSDSVPITVVSIDATVNPTTRNVRVRSSVPNPGYLLRPGMFVDVEVPVDQPRSYVTVPVTAVRRASFGDHVFTLAPGDPQRDPPGAMRAQQRMVSLGPDLGGRVIVTSGLQDGERIATTGSFKLREGALVMQAPPPQTPPGAPPGAPDADPAAQAPHAAAEPGR